MNEATAANLATLVRRRFDNNNALPVVCVSGLKLSMQAKARSYATPDKPNQDSYEDLEVATWCKVPELDRYFDSDGSGDLKVFAFVPVNLLVALVNENGGLDRETSQRLQALEGQQERDTLDLWSELYGEPLQFSAG